MRLLAILRWKIKWMCGKMEWNEREEKLEGGMKWKRKAKEDVSEWRKEEQVE